MIIMSRALSELRSGDRKDLLGLLSTPYRFAGVAQAQKKSHRSTGRTTAFSNSGRWLFFRRTDAWVK